MTESCGTCRFADPAVLASLDGEPDAALLCHRYPPVMVNDGDGYGPIWPLINATDWCGEHTPRPEP